MAAAPNVGIIEYNDEKYIKEVMAIVKQKTKANISYLQLRNHNFNKPQKFQLVFDMISPFNGYIAEIMKTYYLNGTYVINNPFVVSTNNKIIQIFKLQKMKMPIPKTMVLPNEPDESENQFVGKPYFKEILSKFKFPFILKPYNGYGNINVFVIKSSKHLYKVYKENKNRIMLVQEAIFPVDYYRVFVINKKKVYFLKREPRFIESNRFSFTDYSKLTPELKEKIISKSIQINKEMGYDLSTIEWSITKNGKAYVIDVNDAPNIADPKKAKDMDLHFPKETYDNIVKDLAEMIIEKLNMGREGIKQDINKSLGLSKNINFPYSKLAKQFINLSELHNRIINRLKK